MVHIDRYFRYFKQDEWKLQSKQTHCANNCCNCINIQRGGELLLAAAVNIHQ